MKNTFSESYENQTTWDAELDYIEFRNFMPKLIYKTFPGMFRRQTFKWMEQFKTYVEKNF